MWFYNSGDLLYSEEKKCFTEGIKYSSDLGLGQKPPDKKPPNNGLIVLLFMG